MRTRTMTLSFCAEPDLLEQVEELRRKKMERAGYLSRSAVIRMIFSAGLEALDAGDPRSTSLPEAKPSE